MTVDQAAEFLGVSAVVLRRTLERNSRKAADGGTIAEKDGICARKLGRLWRVWLGSGWLRPEQERRDHRGEEAESAR